MDSKGDQGDDSLSLHVEDPFFMPETLHSPVYDGSCQSNQQVNSSESGGIIVEGPLESEDTVADMANTTCQNTDDVTSFQDGDVSAQNLDHFIENHNVNSQVENHTNGDPVPIDGALSDSEKVAQYSNTSTFPHTTEPDGQFIIRATPRGDVMEEINSTFKFAKMDTPQFANKSFTTKCTEPFVDPSKVSNVTTMQIVPQRILPLGPTTNTTIAKSLSDNPQDLDLHNDPESDPTELVHSELVPSTAPNKQESDIFPNLIFHDKRKDITSPVDPSINASDTVSNYQPAESLDRDIRHPNSVLSSETSSRRLQLIQKTASNTRLKIKHPFPEVVQNVPDSNDESSASDLLLESRKSKPSFPSSFPNHYPIPLPPNEDDRRLRANSRLQHPRVLEPKVAIVSCQSGFSTSLSGSSKDVLSAGNAQRTNTELSVVDGRPEAACRQPDDTTYDIYPDMQLPRRGKLHKDLSGLDSPSDASMDTNFNEKLMVGRATSIPLVQRPSASDMQMLIIDSSQRPLSSPSRQETCYNLTLPISINSPKVSDEHRCDFTSSRIISNNDSSIHKSKIRCSSNKRAHLYGSPPFQRPQLLSNVIRAQQNLIKHSQDVEDILSDYQLQKDTVQVQKSELERLKVSDNENSEKIQTLECEKEALKAKIKKMEQLSIKYKNHMNEVVIAQKHLMRESQKIHQIQSDAKLFQASYNSREAHIQKLESLLHEVREFRAPAERLLAVQKENSDLVKLVQESSKINKLLQNDLDKNAMDLGRERQNVSQLQKQLNVQIETRQDLMGHLKAMRCGLVEDLTSESGILMTILTSEGSIQEKIEHVLCAMDSVKSCGESLERVSAVVPENISIGVEKILQATAVIHGSLQESHQQQFEALKAKFDQLHHSQKTESQLNAVIGDLRKDNATLSSNLNFREETCQGFTTRINDLESELDNCRSVLNKKYDELAVASASSKENSILKLQCQDLENENKSLRSEAGSLNHKTTSIMGELAAVRTTLQETEQEFRQLNEKYSEAQTLIKKFPEEKKAYMSNAKLDVEKARQDVAKASIAAKSELIMRNDALVKNLEQRRTEAESQVVIIKEELQRIKYDRDRLGSEAAQLKDELFTYREKSSQQAKYVEQLEKQSLNDEVLNRQESILQNSQGEITELKKSLENIQNMATESFNAAIQTTKEIQTHVRHSDGLKEENELLKEQNIILQKKLTVLSASTSQLVQVQGPDPSNESTVSHGMSSNNSNLASNSQENCGSAYLTKRIPCNQRKVVHREVPQFNITRSPPIHGQKALYYSQEPSVTATPYSTHENIINSQALMEDITPFSSFSPLRLQSPSSLPDICVVIDDLGIMSGPQDDRGLCAAPGGGSEYDSSQLKHNKNSESRGLSKVTKQPHGPDCSKHQLGNQSPSDKKDDSVHINTLNEQNSVSKELQYFALVQKRTAPQKTTVTLKSALKKSATIGQPATNLLPVSNAPATLKNASSSRRVKGVNKNQRKSAPELGYKRVASGQAVKMKSDGTDLSNSQSFGRVNASNPSSQSQLTYFIEKSPLMPGPKRNDRKRSASFAVNSEEGLKTAKVPRTSLHFKSSTISVHESPIAPGVQSDKPHTRRSQQVDPSIAPVR